MKKKVKLADVLWEAANTHLWSGGRDKLGTQFSCHAIYTAASHSWQENRACNEFIESLGCDPEDAGFEDYALGVGRQGVRYMWLLLAMHVAEDEGIEIEVQS